MGLLHLTLGSFRHRMLRLLTAVASVAIASAVLTVAMVTNERRVPVPMNPGVIVTSRWSNRMLPYSYANRIKNLVKDARGVEYCRWWKGGDERYQFALLATSGHYSEIFTRAGFDPEPGAMEAWRGDRVGIIPDPLTLEKMNWRVGQAVTINTPIGPIPAHVSGVYHAPWPGVVQMHYEYLDEWMPPAMRGLLYTIIVPSDPDRIDPIARAIDEQFMSAESPTVSRASAAWMQEYSEATASINDLLSKTNLVIILVMVMVAATSISMSLRERRGEMAILRTIGFSRGTVFRLIVFESTIICVAGAMLGGGTLFAFFHQHGMDLGTGLPLMDNLTVDVRVFLVVIASALSAAVLLSLAPALVIARQDVLRAMDR